MGSRVGSRVVSGIAEDEPGRGQPVPVRRAGLRRAGAAAGTLCRPLAVYIGVRPQICPSVAIPHLLQLEVSGDSGTAGGGVVSAGLDFRVKNIFSPA